MYKLDNKIDRIIREDGEIFILYFSGIKRKIKNKYLKICMNDFLNEGYSINQSIFYYRLLKKDHKEYIKNKNKLNFYQFKNIMVNNKINWEYMDTKMINKKLLIHEYFLYYNDNGKKVIQKLKNFENIKITKEDADSCILSISYN